MLILATVIAMKYPAVMLAGAIILAPAVAL